MSSQSDRSLCIVVSAPSGGGKTTLCQRLLAEFPSMVYSVSCTTRKMRDGEADGKSYRFMEEHEFKRLVDSGEFFEYAKVHGHWYGTLRSEVEDALKSGRDVLMDIDVQGAESIRNLVHASPGSFIADAFVDVFIMPPSMEVLEKRLRGRGHDSEEVIRARLRNAEQEMKEWRKYKYMIVNDNLDEAYDALRAVVVAEHCRRSRT